MSDSTPEPADEHPATDPAGTDLNAATHPRTAVDLNAATHPRTAVDLNAATHPRAAARAAGDLRTDAHPADARPAADRPAAANAATHRRTAAAHPATDHPADSTPEPTDLPTWPAVGPGDRCPCLSGNTYGECCRPFHRGDDSAPTAERLMRSRYSAFVVGDARYLLATWHPSTRPAGGPDALALDPALRWYRLDILSRTGGGMLDSTGTVEFVARHRREVEGGARPERGELHETSTFNRIDREWFYVAG